MILPERIINTSSRLLRRSRDQIGNMSVGMAKEKPKLFNMKAVVNRTGLNPATLRAWERRYGLPQPRRTTGGHRQYSQRDINILRWLIERQEEGISISHAAELWRSNIDQGEDPLLKSGTGQVSLEELATPNGNFMEKLRQEWISSCLAFDRERAELVLSQAFATFKPDLVCIQLLQKGLAEVGARWYRGEASVQQEHFTSSISVQRMEMLIAAAPPPTRDERIVVASAPGDYHTFSPLLLTYLLRRRGWDVIYLGADVPVDELESAMETIQPRLIIISAQLLHTAASLTELALSAAAHGPKVAYGGQIFNALPSLRERIPAYFLGASIDEALLGIADLVHGQHEQPIFIEPGRSYQKALAQYRARRSLIESHVWGTHIASGSPTSELASMNSVFAQNVEAALQLGDITLLGTKFPWAAHLFAGYRISEAMIIGFILSYHQAAKVHLGESAEMIVQWLAELADDIVISQQGNSNDPKN